MYSLAWEMFALIPPLTAFIRKKEKKKNLSFTNLFFWSYELFNKQD